MLNLDTHIVIHALAGELRPVERTLLAAHAWSISSIVLWEIAKLAQLGRIDVNLDDREVRRILSRIRTWPITLAICRAIQDLDFRGDPADELIAATSVVHNLPLLTRDRRLLASKRVPLAT